MSHSKMNEETFLGKNIRVALVHDWLVTYRGGEKVLESLAKLFPQAPIYTLFYNPSQMPEWFKGRDIRYPKVLNGMRGVRKLLLPFLPSAIESLDLRDFDLILSSSSCVAKGVIPSVHAKHICYIHSPMRYIWDQRHEYFRSMDSTLIVPAVLNLLLSRLRIWDVVSSNRVDAFIANSNFVKQRVSKFYRRDANVIYPPVYLNQFQKEKTSIKDKSDYFLVAGAFVPYKRFDLAIQACQELGLRLIVAGSGPSERYLRNLAEDKTEFIISPSSDVLADLMRKAQALIYPGVEDFGITSIEAMASGTPVIALEDGGALDFITKGLNGLFFKEQTVEALKEVLQNFNLKNFHIESIVKSTERFSEENFLNAMRSEILRVMGI